MSDSPLSSNGLPNPETTDESVQSKWDRFAATEGNDDVALARILLTAPVASATRTAPTKAEAGDLAENDTDIVLEPGPFE